MRPATSGADGAALGAPPHGHALTGLDGQRFDAVVIGGGILGAGVARELARRGRRCLLVEKQDFASGTTSRSTRLIHGGLRYLENYDFGLVREGLRERAWLLRSAPNLVTPLRFVLPFHGTPLWQRLRLRAGLTLYDVLSPRRSLPRHRMLDREAVRTLVPSISQDGLRGGAEYWDAQIELPERLVVDALRAAEDAGATVRNHVAATALYISNRGIDGLELTSRYDGSSASVRTWSVINASGPWADSVLEGLGVTRPPLLRLNQGSHLVYPRLADHAVAFEHPEDGRLCFTVPWQGMTMVGTTEVDIEGDPGAARVTPGEVRYLTAAVQGIFPGAAPAPIWASVGVRSLFRGEREASRVSRRHLLVDHRDDGVHGLVTVAGGKLTAWRSIAAEVVDDILHERDHGATHPDSAIGLPAAPAPPEADRTSQRLWRLYGRRAGEVTAWTERDGWWAEPLLPGSDAIRAEVAHAVEREWARTLGDIVLRRLGLGSAPDLGRATAEAAGEVLVARLGWDRGRVERDLNDLDAENAERKLPAPT